MVCLVLEDYGRESVDRLRLFGEQLVAVAQYDPLRPHHRARESRNRETSLPSRGGFGRRFDDLRVQVEFERFAGLVETLHGDHPPENPHLRSGDADARVLRVLHRCEHPAAQDGIVVRPEHPPGHRSGLLTQDERVGRVSDGQYAHDFALPGVNDPLLCGAEPSGTPGERQCRGRAGRQGDPGETRFFMSLEDDLMRLFGGDRIMPMVERLGLKDDEPLQAGMLTKQIEAAQKRIEGRNFEIRKHVLEYDNVMNRQREIIYGQRRRVLMGENVRDNIIGMAYKLIDAALSRHCASDDGTDWDIPQLTNYLENLCIHHGKIAELEDVVRSGDRDALAQALKDDAKAFYEERETALAEIGLDMREVERVVLLRAVDVRWMDHIDAMDRLRDGIGFRAYSGKNPVTEYQIEAGYMFDELNHLIREDTVRRMYQLRIERTPERVQAAVRPVEGKPIVPGNGQPRQPKRVKPSERVGRNDPCPCGSGLKYKNCCGRKA